MINKMDNIKESDRFTIKCYTDVETNKEYNLLIYNCSVNDVNRDFVVGSIIGNPENIEDIKKYIDDLIWLRFNNASDCFIAAKLKMAAKNKIFDNINLSYNAYKLLIDCESNQYFREIFVYQAKETILDDVTKRFTTIHNNKEPFNSISYYTDLENQQYDSEKSLKKVI